MLAANHCKYPEQVPLTSTSEFAIGFLSANSNFVPDNCGNFHLLQVGNISSKGTQHGGQCWGINKRQQQWR